MTFPKRHNYPVSIGKITYKQIIDPHVTWNIKIEAKLGRNRWFCEVEMQNCLGANLKICITHKKCEMKCLNRDKSRSRTNANPDFQSIIFSDKSVNTPTVQSTSTLEKYFSILTMIRIIYWKRRGNRETCSRDLSRAELSSLWGLKNAHEDRQESHSCFFLL